MKKPPVQWILMAVVVIVIICSGILGFRAWNALGETQITLDRTQLNIQNAQSEIAEIQSQQEQEAREARQKALDEKKRQEEAAVQEAVQTEITKDGAGESDEGADASSESSDAFASDADHTESNGHIVGIDPGHQGSWVDMSALEPNAPGSSEMKARCTTGTTGNYTGLEEYQLNLDVSLKLRDILEERGYTVVMTREDNDANISNAERAQKVADAGAEIYVRVHANSSDDTSVKGALTMCPSSSNPYVGNMYDECYRLAEVILDSYCQATGMGNRGIMTTDTMTGINWSSVPVTIIEMGFMSNQSDDTTMADSNFQNTMAEGIANGVDAYFAQ